MDRSTPKPSNFTTNKILSKPDFFEINSEKRQGIKLEGWSICSKKDNILSSNEIENYTKELGFPLPEMIFGNNFLVAENASVGLSINFNPLDALRAIDKNSTSILQVSYADEWLNERSEWKEVNEKAVMFDWTYSTNYSGTISSGDTFKVEEDVKETIDLEALKKVEPILFYTDNILFEDELGDNGSAMLNVKVRVMASGFFILHRFSLRVDNVLYRFHDTRVYHQFGTRSLLMEYSTRECSYKEIAKEIGRMSLDGSSEDRSKFADMQLVYSLFCNLYPEPNTIHTKKISW